MKYFLLKLVAYQTFFYYESYIFFFLNSIECTKICFMSYDSFRKTKQKVWTINLPKMNFNTDNFVTCQGEWKVFPWNESYNYGKSWLVKCIK